MNVKELEDRITFLKASVTHERENLDKVEDSFPVLKAKVTKMQELLDGAKASVEYAHDEADLIQGRMEVAGAELAAVESELADSREG